MKQSFAKYQKIRIKLFMSLFFSVLFCMSFISCSNKEDRGWIKTIEGYYIYGKLLDQNAVYHWDGDTRGSMIHGKGKLTVFLENGKYKNTAIIDAYYGTINNKDWLETPEGKFVGVVEDNHPNGLGVLVHDSCVEIGEFKEGHLDGKSVQYVNDGLRYRGEMSDGKYDGQGMKVENGNIYIGKWDDGLLTESSIALAGEEVKRLWNRVTFSNSKNQEDDKTNSYNLYKQGRDVFCDSLATQLSNYIQSEIEQTVEDRTNWLSVQPIRMFWESIFTSREKRIEGWIKALEDHGLSNIDIEEFINAKVEQYNNLNPDDQLNKVKISSYKNNQIISESVFKNINDREVSGWGDNLWFEFFLACVASIIIVVVIIILSGGSLLMAALTIAIHTWGLSLTIAAIVMVVFFIISLFNWGIEQDIINGILQNYINYFSDQNIINQIL